jgi:hypothetical protein
MFKLPEKSSACKIEHHALLNVNFFFFLFLWVCVALLDPADIQCGSGFKPLIWHNDRNLKCTKAWADFASLVYILYEVLVGMRRFRERGLYVPSPESRSLIWIKPMILSVTKFENLIFMLHIRSVLCGFPKMPKISIVDGNIFLCLQRLKSERRAERRRKKILERILEELLSRTGIEKSALP